jgi:hypothetical protein
VLWGAMWLGIAFIFGAFALAWWSGGVWYRLIVAGLLFLGGVRGARTAAAMLQRRRS